ncbi:MAG TPA: CRTAC1 family protein [Thermoanaerobaculia bacterium]|nr:CRTAC1 family protein [Thermoanaerobaculia bacterium]
MTPALLFAVLAGPAPGGCPVTFTDVAAQAGLHFVHDRGATPEHRLPEMYGSGVAWLDYDNDGWMDLYVVQSGPLPPAPRTEKSLDHLYHNNHDGTFTDVTEKAGIRNMNYGMGAVAADYDNDGFVDLYVTGYRGNVLYHNNGDGTFTDVTAKAGVAGPRWGTAAAWADFDGDGYLDLFVGQYADDTRDKDLFCGDRAAGIRDYCPPVMYDGTLSVLYRNNGDGTFTDVTKSSGLGKAVGKVLGAMFVDLDLDGRPDLYIVNDGLMNFLFHNLGKGTFEDISVSSGTGFGLDGNPKGGMGVDAGDLDADGLPDLVVANYETEMNEHYRNLGSGVFEDLSITSGLGPPTVNHVKFGLNFLDADNSGNLDVFVASGHIFERPRRQGMTFAQPLQLFWNDGRGRFEERACGSAFSQPVVARGSAVADYDNDGDPDIAVSTSGGPLLLLRNDGAHGRWLGVELVGKKSNRQGIGARLVAETPSGRKLTRFVEAGSSYLSSSDPRVLFGLAAEASVKTLTIYWPSGIVQVVDNLPAGRYVRIEETAAKGH